MTKNTPVYEFISYRLLKAKINRTNDGNLEYFSVKVEDGNLTENNNYIIKIIIHIKYDNNEMSELLFESVCKINDLDWFNQISSPTKESLFLSVVFPYIRSKIYSITDDSKGALTLPIIDLRCVDVTNGLKLKPVYDKSSK